MKIGVFDSGIGGLSVALAIEKALAEHEVVFVNDAEHMPYGTKRPEELLALATPILKNLEGQGCGAIVLACNTVSTTIAPELRRRLNVPLISLAPMVKPAALLTRTGVIAVCATPTTLASPRYAELRAQYTKDVVVLEPDCSQWAYMIEHAQIDEQIIRQQIEDVCLQGSDVIVLGCTHYHWIENVITDQSDGRAKVLQPTEAIIRQLKRVLALPV